MRRIKLMNEYYDVAIWRENIDKEIQNFFDGSTRITQKTIYKRPNKFIVGIEYLVDKVIDHISINASEDQIAFFLRNDEVLVLYHEQDYCENVFLEDIDGDLLDICNVRINTAEERVSFDEEEGLHALDSSDTWTFYTIRSVRGTVTIRFHGTSNGYYSERCDIALIKYN